MKKNSYVPEMMNEGQKSILKFLQSNPPIQELLNEIEGLKNIVGFNLDKSVGFERNETGEHDGIFLQGFELLPPETQELWRKTQEANNYLLTLALDLIATQKKYDYLPSSPSLFLLTETITKISKNRDFDLTANQTRKNDRHKVIGIEQTEDKYSITQINTQSKEMITIDFVNLQELKHGKGIKKNFAFLLAKSAQYNFAPEIGFSLQELVDLGMYSNIKTARVGIKNALDNLLSIKFSGTIYKNKKPIVEAGGVLYTYFDIKNNYVNVSINEKMNVEFFAPYFALLPTFSYSLNGTNSFDLCEYIFLIARQNYKAIRENGYFNISFSKIREILELPLPEDITGKYKPKQYVIDPIFTAINEIQEKAKTTGNADINITTHEKADYKNIYEWLEGYISVELNNEIKEKLIELANKRDAQIVRQIEQKEKRQGAKKKK